MSLLLAAILLLRPSQARSQEVAPSQKRAETTSRIFGRALDAGGRPVAGATVCLARYDDGEDELPEITVIAQLQSKTDGRFELTPLESDVKKALGDSPPPIFGIWVQKKGLALAHTTIFGEPSAQPLILCMSHESPVAIRIQNPNNTPCESATVTPIFSWLAAGRWDAIPESIQHLLKTRSAGDGRVDIPGFSGQLALVAIETAQFGVQNVAISALEKSPVAITLRETRILDGRILLPQGEKADLSKLKLMVNNTSQVEGSDVEAKSCKQTAGLPTPGT